MNEKLQHAKIREKFPLERRESFFFFLCNRKKKVVKVWWMSVKPIQHIFTSNHHQSLANIKNSISTNFYVSKQTIDSKKNFREFSQKLLQNSLIRLWRFLRTKTTFFQKLEKKSQLFHFFVFFVRSTCQSRPSTCPGPDTWFEQKRPSSFEVMLKNRSSAPTSCP